MLDYRKEIFPLSNFVLWSKGWYVWPNSKINKWHSADQLLKEIHYIFSLDDYLGNLRLKDYANIALIEYEKYSEWCKANVHSDNVCKLSIREFLSRIEDAKCHMTHYDNNDLRDAAAIIWVIYHEFMFINKDNICLKKPIYGKGMPICASATQGMTYKQMNDLANKTFRK